MKRKRIIIAGLVLTLASLSSCIRIDRENDTQNKTSDSSDNTSSRNNSTTESKETITTESTNNKTTSETTTEIQTNEYISVNLMSNGNIDIVEVVKGEKLEKPSDPVKTGYVFKGWYQNSNGSGDAFDFDTPITKEITLFAIFVKEANKYTVSFDIDGIITSQTVVENSKALEPEKPTKAGYTFIGWCTSKTDTNTKFNFNTSITSNITLYAIFEKDPVYYTITFDIDGVTTTSKVLENNRVEEPATPTKTGYVFKGWYENINDESSFDFNTEITSNITLYALFEKAISNTYGSYEEGAYVEWSDTSLSNVSVSYKKTTDDSYTSVDKELIRLDTTNKKIRCDIVGLEKGEYIIKCTKSDKTTFTTDTITVTSYDRSGYAHFAYSSDSTGINVVDGIGAYTNSGTLKSNATVVYVTDETKNTVTANIAGKTYTGLVSILQAQEKSSTPLDIRIIGTISAATWNKIDYKVNGVTSITPNDVIGANGEALGKTNYSQADIIKAGYNTLDTTYYSELNGLTNKIKYDSSKKEFDSYYNMADISKVKNVTVEGIGVDATIFQWGFTWKNSSSVEIRNLIFDDYTEDACSFEGSDDSKTISGFKTGHIWVHNNQFNEGINYWDVCNEQDKHEGDGATDFKKNAFITLSYNHYIKNHKTGLVGGSNSQHTACITFHHNYYEECSSRLPLARQANMHMYNNYYYKSSSYSMSIRANGYAFLENNYFEGGQNPYELQTSTDNGNGYVKALNNIFDNVSITADTYYMVNNVTSREEAVENTNVYSTTFDTDSTIFYYDSTNKVSNVEVLHTAEEAKDNCITYAGVHKNK